MPKDTSPGAFDDLMATVDRSMVDLASDLCAEMRQLDLFTVRSVVISMLAAGSLGFAAGRLLL